MEGGAGTLHQEGVMSRGRTFRQETKVASLVRSGRLAANWNCRIDPKADCRGIRFTSGSMRLPGPFETCLLKKCGPVQGCRASLSSKEPSPLDTRAATGTWRTVFERYALPLQPSSSAASRRRCGNVQNREGPQMAGLIVMDASSDRSQASASRERRYQETLTRSGPACPGTDELGSGDP